MENTIINNNAIISFRKIEEEFLNNIGKEFNTSKYIRTLIDNCRKDGQMVLDFYHDVCDEDGEFAGGYVDYSVFRFAIEDGDLNPLAKYLEIHYNGLVELASDNELVGAGETVPYVYVARLNKLLNLDSPKIIINNEKRYLLHHIIANSRCFELIGKTDSLPEADTENI
ncbi:MAG: hypothetical protein IIY33_08080 [Erysipelotrichaceae bacterium]|nr:hypothetical protein [Erysipelotrichaceae bacterium]